MTQIQNELCVDQGQIYLSGSSNGAMFGYELVSRLPIFAGFVPWYGAFLANMLRPPPALAVRPTTLMHMQGLRDRTIPPAGGESADHWLYVSMNATLDTCAE